MNNVQKNSFEVLLKDSKKVIESIRETTSEPGIDGRKFIPN